MYKIVNMKIIKYTLYVLGSLLAFSNFGWIIQGRIIPIIWIVMTGCFLGAYFIKNKKSD